MKVRIGNDICLHVTLLGRTYDSVNIKSIKAYLINTSRKEDIRELIDGERRTVRYVGRYPMEPHTHAYRSTPYDLCHSGHPTFHVHPVCYTVAPYIGFGVHPHSFDAFRCHHFDHCGNPFDPYYNQVWGWGVPENCHCDLPGCEWDHLDCPDPFKFRAPVKSTQYNNKIKVYFPAEDQHYTGTYKLVVIAKIYEPGYAPNDLRTITMDYKEVFTIVGSSDDADYYNAVEISVGNDKQATGIIINGTRTLCVNGTGKLTATVLPADIDEDGVTWQVFDGSNASSRVGSSYVSIVNTTSTTCKLLCTGLPQQQSGSGQLTPPSTPTVTVRATSIKTPSVYADVVITLTDQQVDDIYTQAGAYQDNNQEGNDRREYINLTLTDGSNVQIDTTKETVWYEG